MPGNPVMMEAERPSSFNVKDDPFLQRIKTATAEQHSRLEAQPLLHALMAPNVTVVQYGSYLARMKKIAGAYENSLLPLLSSSQPPFVPTRSSSLLIAGDLESLRPFVDSISPLPDFRLPQNLSLPFAWGFAYVMEGAKLGGKVIARHIQKTLGFTESNGAAYIADSSADTASDWKGFLQKLSAYAAIHCCEDEVVNGAVFGFVSIYEYFEANRQGHAD